MVAAAVVVDEFSARPELASHVSTKTRQSGDDGVRAAKQAKRRVTRDRCAAGVNGAGTAASGSDCVLGGERRRVRCFYPDMM